MTEQHTPSSELPDERAQRRREYSGAGSTLGLAMLVIVVVGVAVWYFEFRGANPSGGGDGEYGIIALPEELNTTGQAAVAEQGRAAPNFVLATLDGGEMSLADLRGQYVLVNFWAAWCDPCVTETPALRDFAEEQGSSLTVIGINLQERPETAREFVEGFGVEYPILLDRSGEVANGYRMTGPPLTVLIDPDGVIVDMKIGEVLVEDLDRFAARVAG